MSSLPVEVRQCPKCQQAAVVLVMEWEHTSSGININQSTREYRCQNCGAWQVRLPQFRVLAYWIIGAMFSLACFPGLPFLYLAWRQHTFDKRVPIVPGTPAPRLRFPGGAPKRTCGKCGGIAKTIRITRHTHNGVPTGTDYEYQCGQCNLPFATENILGHVVSSFGGLALAGVTFGFYFGATSAGWKWGGTIVAALLTGFIVAQNVIRLRNRARHKVLEENVL